MNIEILKVINFRNYKDQTVEFCNDVNIIYGLNGQGKTNILEAVFFCAMGSSFRTSKTRELIKWNEENMISACSVKSTGGDKVIEISQNIYNKKTAKVNKISITKMEELLGNLKVVCFTPHDLLIVNGSPAERRRFMDTEICQMNPLYYRFLANYNKVLDGRNTLLKQAFTDKSAIDLIEIWNEKLIEYGSYIIFHRTKFIDKIDNISKSINENITKGKESINLKYSTDFKDLGNIDVIKLQYNELLNKTINEDIKRGSTSIGPHRDDLKITMGDIDIKSFGSQGQKRTASLSLKLSEIELIREEYNEYPVVLLDDVMSELDLSRQNYLIENFDGIQIIITCTDVNNFNSGGKRNIKYFDVSNGVLESK